MFYCWTITDYAEPLFTYLIALGLVPVLIRKIVSSIGKCLGSLVHQRSAGVPRFFQCRSVLFFSYHGIHVIHQMYACPNAVTSFLSRISTREGRRVAVTCKIPCKFFAWIVLLIVWGSFSRLFLHSRDPWPWHRGRREGQYQYVCFHGSKHLVTSWSWTSRAEADNTYRSTRLRTRDWHHTRYVYHYQRLVGSSCHVGYSLDRGILESQASDIKHLNIYSLPTDGIRGKK